MNWLKRFAPKRGVIGLELNSDGLAIAAKDDKGAWRGLGVFNSKLQQDQSEQDYLEGFIEKHHLNAGVCNVVLPTEKYQLLLAEAPEVPDEELREAVRWRIKDLISIPLEQAALDVFLLPDNAVRGKRMLYVAVSEKSYLKECIALVSNVGLTLNSIDIPELALRNVALLKDEGKAGSRGVAMVRIGAGAGNVSLYQEGNLYLSRSFQINYNGGLLSELPADSLTLEIQRSLDYYERQMAQRLPAALYIFGENISEDKVTEDIRRGVSGQVKVLDLKEIYGDSEDFAPELVAPCFAAIGASMRGEVSP